MISSDKLENEINRGQKAAQILSEPLVKEAFATLKQECYDQWQKSPARDAEGREKLWLMLKSAERVEQHLRSVMETGKLADATLRQKLARATGKASTVF